jgi:single-strand DNA-binding protein
MSTKIPINIAGNLVADPELTYGESGVAHAKLRVAVNQRMQGADGSWQDGEPVFPAQPAYNIAMKEPVVLPPLGGPARNEISL